MGINAVDAQIPLQGTPLTTTLKALADTNDVYSQMALRQQQAKNAQTVDQQNQLAVKQTQLDQADQQKITQYMSDPANAARLASGDVSELYKMGVQAKNGQAVQTHFLDLHQKSSTLQKSVLENNITMGNEVASGITGLQSLDEKDRAAAYPGMLDSLAAKGVDISHLPKQGEITDFSDTGLKTAAARMAIGQTVAEQGLKLQKEKGAVALQGAQTTEASAKALELAANETKAKMDALKVQQDTQWAGYQQASGLLSAAAAKGPAQLQAALSSLPQDQQQHFAGVTDPQALLDLGRKPEEIVRSQEAKATLMRENARDAQTAAYQKGELNLGAGRLSVEQQNLALRKVEAGIGQPGGISPQAQMIVDGNLDPTTTRSIIRKNPGITAQLKAADPNFDEANLEKRYNTLKEFTNTSTGKAGGQVIALNTLIHHADLYLEASDALKNGTFKPGNAAYNKIATMFGSAPPQNQQIIARMLSGEAGKVATNGVPAEGEVKAFADTMGSANSPAQAEGAARALIGIAAGKLGPLNETVKDAKLDKVISVVKPEAREILTRRGYNPDTMKPNAGGGTGYQAGHVYGGMTYNGGDPNSASSWTKK